MIKMHVCCKMGRFRFGGRLRVLKSKLLINKIIKIHRYEYLNDIKDPKIFLNVLAKNTYSISQK